MPMNLFADHLGPEYARLAELIKHAHLGDIKLEGYASVQRGNRIASLLCSLLGLPPNSESVKLTVNAQHRHDHVLWMRNFGGVAMTSCFVKDGDHLMETIGPVKFHMKLTVENGTLRYLLLKSSFLNLNLPAILSPSLDAFESEEAGFYHFGVRIELPVIGKLIEYKGKLLLTRSDTSSMRRTNSVAA
jgi:hypothetical protein